MKKRILAIVLCLTMVLTSGSFAFAEGDEATSEDYLIEAEAAESLAADTNAHEESEEPYVKPIDYTDAASVLNPPARSLFRMRSWTKEEHEDIHTSKTLVYDPSTGKYTIRLESYVKGEPEEKERIPSDIVLVVDQSTSMSFCFECGSGAGVMEFTGVGNGVDTAGMDANTNWYRVDHDLDSSTDRIKVFYCPGNKVAGYESCSHSMAGWFSNDHADDADGTNTGTRYVPSIDNAKVTSDKRYNKHVDGGTQDVYARIFYNGLTTSSVEWNTNITKTGKYYLDMNQDSYMDDCEELVYCENHAAWHLKSAAACTNSNPNTEWYVPRNDKSENVLGSHRFVYVNLSHHAFTTTSELNTSEKYWVKQNGNSTVKGDSYIQVSYKNGAWKGTNNKVYTVASSDGASTSGQRIFYKKCSEYGSRYQAAQKALAAFTESIYDYSEQHNVKNRIAVTTFASPAYTEVKSYSSDNSTATTVKKSNASNNTYANSLHFVNSSSGQNIVNSAIDSIHDHGGGTYTHLGLEMANNILNNAPVVQEDIDKNIKRNKIVILFTDGEPQVSSTADDTYGGADRALDQAYIVKNNSKATLYSIGIFSEADANELSYVNEATKVTTSGYITGVASKNKFMHLISSNYSGEATMANTYPVSSLKQGYYLSAGDEEGLMEAFLGIAEQINAGAAGLEALKSDTVVRDVISQEFQIDTDRPISFHTEACVGAEYDENGEPIEFLFEDDNNTDIDSKISIKKNGQGTDKTVEVTGFNFSENYVAIDKDFENLVPRGRKLVIEVPIELDPSQELDVTAALTNKPEESGIFREYTLYENFDAPVADIPTNVTIEKQTVGANVPADKTFDFDVTYTAFNGYLENDSADSGNYLQANAVEKTFDRPIALSGLDYNKEAKDVYRDKILFDKSKLMDSIGDMVVIGTQMTITETVSSDYKVEYSLDGGETWKDATSNNAGTKVTITETVTPNMNIIVRNTLQKSDLVITKTIEGNVNPEQDFVFNVKGGKGVDLDVVIPAKAFNNGTASVKIKDLEVGDYTVQEIIDWSWRYEIVDSTTQQTAKVVPSQKATVNFTNKVNYIYWLSGDDCDTNVFTDESLTQQDIQNLLNL